MNYSASLIQALMYRSSMNPIYVVITVACIYIDFIGFAWGIDSSIYEPAIFLMHSFKLLVKNASSSFLNTIESLLGISSGLIHFSSPSFSKTILVHPYAFEFSEHVSGKLAKFTWSDETAVSVPILHKNNKVIKP